MTSFACSEPYCTLDFLPLAGKLAVLTICQDFICMLRPRFDKAPECLVSVIMSEFVARYKELSKNCQRTVKELSKNAGSA